MRSRIRFAPDNNNKTTTNRSLPASLAALTSLQYLFLGSNKLRGPVFASLFGLPKLEIALLDNNRFSGHVAFPRIPRGDVSDETPPKLGSLDLSNNMLTGTLPAGLGRFTQLRHLAFSNNSLRL